MEECQRLFRMYLSFGYQALWNWMPLDSRARRRCFFGAKETEAVKVLGISEATLKRDWEFCPEDADETVTEVAHTVLNQSPSLFPLSLSLQSNTQ